MTTFLPILALVMSPALPHAPVGDTSICIAPAAAQVVGSGSAAASSATTDAFKSYLTGPTISVTVLSAKLASQAREEAKRAGCRYLLSVTVKQERKSESGGLFGRVASRAAQDAAWSAGITSSSVTGRVVASAVAGAASAAADFANTIRMRDELELAYQLQSSDGTLAAARRATRKAKSDGEDLLTPLVERAAEEIANAITK